MLVEDQKLDAVVKLPERRLQALRRRLDRHPASSPRPNSGGTDHVWFYDVHADGWSLDDKRTPLLAGRQARPRARRRR